MTCFLTALDSARAIALAALSMDGLDGVPGDLTHLNCENRLGVLLSCLLEGDVVKIELILLVFVLYTFEFRVSAVIRFAFVNTSISLNV